MKEPLPHAYLKEKQRDLRRNFPEPMGLRVHRSISWIGCAEACDDDEGQFIFLWIAFNAAYAKQHEPTIHSESERTRFLRYFNKLVALDAEHDIHNVLWDTFSGPMHQLMRNRYVYSPFWEFHHGGAAQAQQVGWEQKFKISYQAFLRVFQRRRNAEVLSHVFDRLYVLRNQLMHGGATWKSSTNPDQKRDGAAILRHLVPVFVDIMMDHPNEDWGQPPYPPVE
ncbi:MAG: hypothetical protein GDA40_00850 [Rhodobacteraceae bacterium]|nr:hypothetical protein [Paracoccaceae bacterium]